MSSYSKYIICMQCNMGNAHITVNLVCFFILIWILIYTMFVQYTHSFRSIWSHILIGIGILIVSKCTIVTTRSFPLQFVKEDGREVTIVIVYRDHSNCRGLIDAVIFDCMQARRNLFHAKHGIFIQIHWHVYMSI